MVKTWPSTVGGVGSIPGHRAKIPHALPPKIQDIKNRSNIVTNPHQKNIFLGKQKNWYGWFQVGLQMLDVRSFSKKKKMFKCLLRSLE